MYNLCNLELLKNMSKIYKIILFSFIAMTFGIIGYYFFAISNESLNNGENFFVPSATDPDIKIKTKNGKVKIKNIYQNPLENLSLNGITFLENDNYSADFYPQDQGFLLVIKNSDVQSARDMLEKDFLEKLGISEEDACKLKVSLSVPYSVNKELAGGEYGLSFCPNGKKFFEN